MVRFIAATTVRTLLVILWLIGTAWCAEKPPAIEFLSPREGQTVSGDISIEARVANASAVDFVDFYIQEPGAKDRYSWKEYGAPPYVWGGKGQKLDTRLFTDGAASVVLFCYTGGQKPAAEKRVNFTIDNGKPKVKIVTPSSGALLDPHTVVEVEARDPKGVHAAAGIVAVSLYVDGSLVKRLASPPYRYNLDGCLMAPGLHSMSVLAEDTEGLTELDRIVVTRDKKANPLAVHGTDKRN